MSGLGARPLGLAIVCVALLLGTAALFLPAAVQTEGGTTGSLVRLESLALCIADVRGMASGSRYPLPTALSYAGALVLGIFTSILGATSTARSRFRELVRTGIPRVRPVFVWLLLVTTIIAPFVFDLTVGEGQFSHRFFRWVASSRIGLLLWAEMVFLYVYAASLWCSIQLSIWLGKGARDERSNQSG